MQLKKKLILTAIFILTLIGINLIMTKPVQAVNQIVSTDIESINEQKYPGVKKMLQELKGDHPNWNFKILYTGLNWKEVIAYEYMGHEGSPKNLVPATAKCEGDWICLSCGRDRYYDNGTWRCASETTIQYMMDARNSINNSDVFQFMELTYQEATYENIQKMVAGTFLDRESYINAIISAGKSYNVSPYYIVALGIQEQGRGGSSTASGNYPGYQGYYNVFNINASGNGNDTIIRNALSYAKNKGWDTLEKSIDGGVQQISKSYLGRGQNTLYFKKFDVENSDGQLYWHQYQQNILAAQNEGVTIRKAFEDINAIDSNYTFIIPLYENTPKVAQGKPSTTKTINTLITDLVRVNVRQTIALRKSPAGEVISGTSLYANEIVTRLEQATQKVNGTYWDKVMKSSGTIAYVARETYDYESEYKLYLIPVAERNTSLDSIPQEPTVPEEPPKQDPEPPMDNPFKPGEKLPSGSEEKIKIEEDVKQVTVTPSATVEEILNLVGDNVTITDKDGNKLDKNAHMGTGCKINGTYTVVMLGDVNGDGEVNSGDTLAIKQHIKEVKKFSEEVYIEAADINGDGEVNSGDSLIAKQHIKDVKYISLQK